MPLNRYTLNTRTLNGPAIEYRVEYPATQIIEFDQKVVFRINPERQLIGFDQNVQTVTPYAAAQLIEFDQNVIQNFPSKKLIAFNQFVSEDGVVIPEELPPCVVYIDGKDVRTLDRCVASVSVTYAEDQNTRASVEVVYEANAPILIPALNGKSLDIDVFNDANEPERLFTGWIERSSYNRESQSVDITASDLRSERIGEEDRDDLLQLTQAVYSEVTQKEEAEGDEFVNEMMKTVVGSLGYDKSGELYYYGWEIDGKPTNLLLNDNDFSYDSISVEYQTRSEVINSVEVNMDYRYTGLRVIQTEIEGKQDYREWGGKYAGSFVRNTIIDKVETGYSPWIATSYELYDMPTVRQARSMLGPLLIYRPLASRCMGFKASMERYLVQPITESYTLTVNAPQSIRAYGKEIRGSSLLFAVDSNADFDAAEFEQREAVYTPTTKSISGMFKIFEWPSGGTFAGWKGSAVTADYLANTSSGGTLPVVDTERPLFYAGLRAALLIAEKQIIESHRKNYVEVLKRGITDVSLGDVIEIDSSTLVTKGQCSSITYKIDKTNGLTSQIKLSISSMNDDGVIPVEDWTQPAIPPLDVLPSPHFVAAPRVMSGVGNINFNRAEEQLEVDAPELGEEITDEGITEVSKTYEVALENQDITLINGW